LKIGFWEIILIVIVIGMIFGVGKIPEIGKQIGRGVRDFKKYSSGKDGEESPKDAAKSPAGSISAPPTLESTGTTLEKPADEAFSKN